MNKQIMKLIRVRLINQFEWSKLSDKNKTIKTHALLTTIGYLAAFVFVIVYAISLPYQMNQDLQLDKVNPYVASLLFWVLGIWTLLSGVKNILVGFDHDQIFVLPIKEWQAKLVNIISSYIIQLILCGIVLFSLQIPLYFFQPFPLINLLIVGIYMIITPLLAISGSLIISLLVKLFLFILNFRSTFIEAFLTLGIFISPLVYGYATVPFNSKAGVINTSFLPISLLEAVKINSWLKIIFLFATVVVIFSGLCIMIKKKYNSLATLLNIKLSSNTPYVLEVRPVLVELLKKEIIRYVSSFTYVINTIITPIILIVIAVCLSMGLLPKFSPIVINSINLTITNSSMYFVIFIVCLTLTTTTSCSFSFEGQRVWIIQSLPISVKELIIAKGLLNILLFTPGLAAASSACWSALGFRGLEFVSHIILLLTSLLCISFLGLVINLKFPNFKWQNEMEVVKQGMSTIITAFSSTILIAVLSITSIFLGNLGVIIVIVIELFIIYVSIKKISSLNYI